jgi:hypothetical protein
VDFSKLDKLTATLRDLAHIPSQVSAEVSKELTKELQKEYTSGSDPYGKPWAPLKPSTLAKGRRPPPLTDTGRMKSGTVAFPLPGAGVAVVVGAEYGKYHQTGTSKMEARPILPDKGMPPKWREIVKRVASKAIAGKFRT